MDIEVEVKKQLNFLRNVQNNLAESTANPKDFGKIIDIFKNPIHRILKLNCYPLLKTFPSSELVSLELEKDFSNKDYEIQLLSLKLAYCLPIENLMQIVKSYDTVFYQIIEGSSEFHYERMCAMNSILELLLTKETEVDSIDMPKQTITGIYVRIAENCFSSNRDISANCIICLTAFLQSKLQNPNNLTYVNYHTSQIKQYLLPRVQLLYEKIWSYEIRIRARMLLLLPYILQNAPKQIQQMNTVQQTQNSVINGLNSFEFNSKLIQNCLFEIFKYNFEIDVIIHTSNVIIKFIQNCKFPEYFNLSQIVWQLFDGIDKFIKKVHYKKELNQILLNILQIEVDLNSKIAISMRTLELSFQVQNTLTRLLFMLYSFDNLITKSIELTYQKKTSAILGLYNQSWFLTKLKDEPEELISCLIIAAIHSEKNKQILLEIMDICNGCIWDGCNIEAIIMYLLLVEECTNVVPYDEIRLDDLINRMNTNQMSFVQKVQTLLIITKKFTESNLISKLDYLNILAEFRTFMIQPVQSPICQINLLQNVYKILYYLCQNFHTPENHIKQQVLELLSDYNDNLSSRRNDQIADEIQEFNKNIVKSLQYGEKLYTEQLQMKIDKQSDSINQNLHLTTYQIAYNIFQQKASSSEQSNLIMNLRCLQLANKNIFTELQLNSKLITGVSDFVQIYCSHVLDISKSNICLGIRVINNCPFQLNNLGIKILLDRNAYNQVSYKVIEELPSYQERQLFYVVKVNPKLSMHFAFDIILSDVRSEAGVFAIRTQNYRISMLEFLIPNKFLYLSSNCFQYISYDSTIILKCNLAASYLLLFKKLITQPFATVILDSGNSVFFHSMKQNLDLISQNVTKNISIGLLAYLISGQNLAIIISNISTQSDQSEVLLEVCFPSLHRLNQKRIVQILKKLINLSSNSLMGCCRLYCDLFILMKKYTSSQQLRRSNASMGRYRLFKHTEIDRANLFEGLPYVQFDAFIRRGAYNQYIRQNYAACRSKRPPQNYNGKVQLTQKSPPRQIQAEKNISPHGSNGAAKEKRIIQLEIRGYHSTYRLDWFNNLIGIQKKSRTNWIKESNPEFIDHHMEEKIYDQNVDLFNEMLQYLRDRIELYMLMMRQAGHKQLDDQLCMSFLKDVTALRYNLLQLSEDIRVLDQNSDENLKLIKLTLQRFETIKERKMDKLSADKKSEEQKIEDKKVEEKKRKIEYIEKNLIGKTLSNYDDQTESEVQKKRAQRLNELLQQKFNFNKSSIVTRESKLILNQDKLEQEKVLLLESNQKASKIKHNLVDNRKRLALEKLKDPTKDPQLRGALEIMSRVLNINIADQFQE